MFKLKSVTPIASVLALSLSAAGCSESTTVSSENIDKPPVPMEMDDSAKDMEGKCGEGQCGGTK